MLQSHIKKTPCILISPESLFGFHLEIFGIFILIHSDALKSQMVRREFLEVKLLTPARVSNRAGSWPLCRTAFAMM
jgi:hypothetical protein